MKKILKEDYIKIEEEHREIYVPNEDNVITSDHKYEFLKTTYKGTVVKDLEITTGGKQKENRIKYSLKSECDTILAINICVKTREIRLKEAYENEYKIKLKDNFVLDMIKSINFIVSNKKSYKMNRNKLRIFYNFFDNKITKKEYRKILGFDPNSVYSNKINKYSCNFIVPFFFSNHTSLSFPQFALENEPYFEIDMDNNVLNILDIKRNDEEEIDIEAIKRDSILVKTKKTICKPRISITYSLLDEKEKLDFKNNQKIHFRNIEEVDLIPISEENKELFKKISSKDNTDNHFRIDSKRPIISIIFYSEGIYNISSYTIRNGEIIYRHDNMNYEKSNSFSFLHYKRKKTIEKNIYISLCFGSKAYGLNSESIFSLEDYVFVVNMQDGYDISKVEASVVFLDDYTILDKQIL